MEEEDIKTADDVAADVDQSRQPPPPEPSIPTTSSTASSTSKTTTPTTTASMSKAAVPVSGPGIAASSTVAAPSGDLDDVGDLFGGGVELEKNFDIHKMDDDGPFPLDSKTVEDIFSEIGEHVVKTI